MILDILLEKNRNKVALDYLEIHLTNHCNLNCACCCHFAPLAEKYFMSKEIFQNDIKRLAFLSKGNIRRIRLMGGEPLLHPQIIEFMEIARLNFPQYEIAIHTNGLLLPDMNEKFWEVCAKFHIDIIVSYYPINLDYTLIYKLATKNNVTVKIDIDTGIKKFRNFKMDISGKQMCIRSWYHCTHANASVNLFEGKLYTCDITAHSIHLAKHFNLPLEYTDKDYNDIYQEEDMGNILKKLNRPHPFCKYCNPQDSEIIDWHISTKEINEWVKI
ncbi:MAG: radical SAM protein [Paludibacteraceae bacterium]|nr:radical SAM protein [Paludibacteraceae bacterium]